jgi:hypothetical protein
MGSPRWRSPAAGVVIIGLASGMLALVLLLIASHRVDAGLLDNETPPNLQ